MLKINEIFLSIQGESTYTGLPCIFIRLSGCNLNCIYCDTGEHEKVNYTLNAKDVVKHLKKFDPIRNLEITGGEPLLQSDIYELITELHKEDYRILLETNGSVDLKNVPSYVKKIVDVKTPGSGHGNSFLLSNLGYLDLSHDNLKFVLSGRDDYEWAKSFIIKNRLSGDNILFSAVYERNILQDLSKWIIDDRLDVRLQLQIHKFIWSSDKKGV